MYRDKEWGAVRKDLMETVQQLEDENKHEVTLVRTRKIQPTYQQLTLLDAQKINQGAIYAEQRVYDYRDKAGKQPAQVLSN